MKVMEIPNRSFFLLSCRSTIKSLGGIWWLESAASKQINQMTCMWNHAYSPPHSLETWQKKIYIFHPLFITHPCLHFYKVGSILFLYRCGSLKSLSLSHSYEPSKEEVVALLRQSLKKKKKMGNSSWGKMEGRKLGRGGQVPSFSNCSTVWM